MRRSLCAAGGFLALCLTPARADACSCAMYLSGKQACEQRWTHDAVFAGRVIASAPTTLRFDVGDGRQHESSRYRLVTFAVTESFVSPATTVTIVTGDNQANCGFPFESGREYLVYAYREQDGRLGTGICQPTRRIEDAADHLAYLRAVPAVPGRAGRLIGRVLRMEPEHRARPREAPPYGGARIVAEGPGITRSAVSTPQGTFEISRRSR